MVDFAIKKSQRQTQNIKDKRHEVLSAHKKKEREMIKKGKREFYLKKCKFLKKLFMNITKRI